MRYVSWRSMAGHSDRVLCLAGEHVCRQDVSEPVSTPVVFDTRCRQAYVASLLGTVMAFAFTPSCSTVSQVWTSTAEGPVLSAPAYLHDARGLAVASAHGVVQCFGSKRGRLASSTCYFHPLASYAMLRYLCRQHALAHVRSCGAHNMRLGQLTCN